MSIPVALCVLWLALLPSLSSRAQSPESSPDRRGVSASGAFFALSVADIEASAAWYSEMFGLRVVMPLSRTDKAAVTVLEGSGLIVELIQHDDAVPLSKAAPAAKEHMFVHGVFKAGFIVDNFDETLAALRVRHVEIAFGPFPARPDQRANVIVRDNGGNLIQIFAR
jgi:catechol 2,3-dioxygenase-like lactoylglutathione lyase family enzyme